jgi:Domain of unknown function (DUF5069)
MKTTIEDRDLKKQAPHSPRERIGGFAILGRTVDKCRASISSKLGEYHYDCPLDNQLFGFKGIKGDQFKTAVASTKSYEDVAAWLQSHGNQKTPAEIKEWSDKVEAARMKDVFAKHSQAERQEVIEICRKLGLDYETVSLFEWLEADDQASFEPHPQLTAK